MLDRRPAEADGHSCTGWCPARSGAGASRGVAARRRPRPWLPVARRRSRRSSTRSSSRCRARRRPAPGCWSPNHSAQRPPGPRTPQPPRRQDRRHRRRSRPEPRCREMASAPCGESGRSDRAGDRTESASARPRERGHHRRRAVRRPASRGPGGRRGRSRSRRSRCPPRATRSSAWVAYSSSAQTTALLRARHGGISCCVGGHWQSAGTRDHYIVKHGLTGVVAACLACCAGLVFTAPAGAATATVESGPLEATVNSDPWRLSFADSRGALLAESALRGNQRPGPLGFETELGWAHATRATDFEQQGNVLLATVATDDPLGRTLAVRIASAGEGAVAVNAVVEGTVEVDATGIGFDAPPDEGFFGFGERSNAVDQRGREVENYVSDGPFPEEDRDVRQADDAAMGRPRPRRLDLLPGALDALQPRLRRAHRPRRDQPFPPRQRRAPTSGASTSTARASTSASSPGRRPAEALARFTRRHRSPARGRGALGLRTLVSDRPAERDPARRRGGVHPHAARRRRAGLRRRDADALPAVRRPATTAPTTSPPVRDAASTAAGFAHLGYFNPLLCVRTTAGLLPGARGRCPADASR